MVLPTDDTVCWSTEVLDFELQHIQLPDPASAAPSTNRADQLSVLAVVHRVKHPPLHPQRLVRTWDTGLPCCVLLPSWVPRPAGQNHWTAPRAQPCPASPGDTKTNQQKSLGVRALPSASWFFCLVAKSTYATKRDLSAAMSDCINRLHTQKMTRKHSFPKFSCFVFKKYWAWAQFRLRPSLRFPPRHKAKSVTTAVPNHCGYTASKPTQAGSSKTASTTTPRFSPAAETALQAAKNRWQQENALCQTLPVPLPQHGAVYRPQDWHPMVSTSKRLRAHRTLETWSGYRQISGSAMEPAE